MNTWACAINAGPWEKFAKTEEPAFVCPVGYSHMGNRGKYNEAEKNILRFCKWRVPFWFSGGKHASCLVETPLM